MPSPRRREQLNVLFREQIAAIVDREVEFVEGAMVTFTRVELSPDGRYATAYISVLGGSAADALAMLEKNVYPVQQAVNRAVRMRPVPKIRFARDDGETRREKVEESLGALKQADGSL
jgi:ribosome-binding factor A